MEVKVEGLTIITESKVEKVAPNFVVVTNDASFDASLVKGFGLKYSKRYNLKPIMVSRNGLDYPIYINGCPVQIDEEDLIHLFDYRTIRNLVILDYKIRQLYSNK